MNQNGCSRSAGTGVHVEPEWVFTMGRNMQLDGILEVHDLHIWSLSAERTALSAHLVIDDLSHWEQHLSAARDLVNEQFGIDHCTFQPELRTATARLMQIEEPYRTE